MTQNDQPAEGTQPISTPETETRTPHVPPVPEELGESEVATPALDAADVDDVDDEEEDDDEDALSAYGFGSPYGAPQGQAAADFGGLGGGMPDLGGFDLSGLMAQAQAMQSQLANAQTELAAMTMTGTAGGGLVTATITGAGEITGLTIKPEACDPEDTETLADLIVAAIRDAQSQMAAVAQAKMGPITGGLGGFGF